MTTCAAIRSRSGMRPSMSPRLLTAAAMKSGAISQALGERVRASSAASSADTASRASTGGHGSDRRAEKRVLPRAARHGDHQERRQHHDERDPRGLRHHDRLELPAIVRRHVHGLDHAAGNGGEKCRRAVDAGEPHEQQAPDGAYGGRKKSRGDDQWQQRHELGDHAGGELQTGRRADNQGPCRAPPWDESHRRARERQRHDREQRAEQPRQRQTRIARSKTAGDAGRERARHRECGNEALGHVLEKAHCMHRTRAW